MELIFVKPDDSMKAEALAFLCPLASPALSDEAQSLEAAVSALSGG